MRTLVQNCNNLLAAFKSGALGEIIMPEDINPGFLDSQSEERLAYFTLPMALNYQRISYKLWESAQKTYLDPTTADVFNVSEAAKMKEEELRAKLMKYKVALQPNKHVQTWHKLAKTIDREWGSLSAIFLATEGDFLKLREIIQKTHKKDFPYLSGPKIFNYWAYTMTTFGRMPLTNRSFIEIAPDTHVIKGSVLLGVITEAEAKTISPDAISLRWRHALADSGIDPIDIHSPLWFWSRGGFEFKLI